MIGADNKSDGAMRKMKRSKMESYGGEDEEKLCCLQHDLDDSEEK